MSSNIYINRELSWLDFNARVLDEATNPDTPLLERIKYMSIFSANLDEFFMVRVAGLMKMRQENIIESDSPEPQLDVQEVLKQIRRRVEELKVKLYQGFMNDVVPDLEKQKIRVLQWTQLNEGQQKTAEEYYSQSILPVLTPLSFDAAHPFPFLSNLSQYMVVVPRDSGVDGDLELPGICFIEIPSILPRLVRLPSEDGVYEYILIEDLIAAHLHYLFIGIDFERTGIIRITRNLDYTLLENEVVDLLKTIKTEMFEREHQEVVRLEVSETLPDDTIRLLCSMLRITEEAVYRRPHPFFLRSFYELYSLPLADLKFFPFNPRLPSVFDTNDDIFTLVRREDILIHHPYESFYTVTEFIAAAANDADVLAIKIMLYRTVGDSQIMEALTEAAKRGKQVTAVVELKARFDEQNNIVWARRLEAAGVNVVFGFVGLKTHSKAMLIVRREKDKIARYVHLSTGNYNPITAKIYTDLGFFTADRDICDDVQMLFNLVTGINLLSLGKIAATDRRYPKFKAVSIGPLTLRSRFVELIDREITNAKAGQPAAITAKMNALVDKELIDKLYEASKAGVLIKLIVRGICCLRAGVPGLSENIAVISVVDRFLEHSRIYHFHAGGADEVYLASADWMPRNMDRRVELLFPIRNAHIKQRVVNEILGTYLKDNVRARYMLPDGSYKLRTPAEGQPIVRAQQVFIDMVRERGLKSKPYDIALTENPLRHGKMRPVATKLKLRRRSGKLKRTDLLSGPKSES